MAAIYGGGISFTVGGAARVLPAVVAAASQDAAVASALESLHDRYPGARVHHARMEPIDPETFRELARSVGAVFPGDRDFAVECG